MSSIRSRFSTYAFLACFFGPHAELRVARLRARSCSAELDTFAELTKVANLSSIVSKFSEFSMDPTWIRNPESLAYSISKFCKFSNVSMLMNLQMYSELAKVSRFSKFSIWITC